MLQHATSFHPTTWAASVQPYNVYPDTPVHVYLYTQVRLYDGVLGPTRLGRAHAQLALNAAQQASVDLELEPADSPGHIRLNGQVALPGGSAAAAAAAAASSSGSSSGSSSSHGGAATLAAAPAAPGAAGSAASGVSAASGDSNGANSAAAVDGAADGNAASVTAAVTSAGSSRGSSSGPSSAGGVSAAGARATGSVSSGGSAASSGGAGGFEPLDLRLQIKDAGMSLLSTVLPAGTFQWQSGIANIQASWCWSETFGTAAFTVCCSSQVVLWRQRVRIRGSLCLAGQQRSTRAYDA